MKRTRLIVAVVALTSLAGITLASLWLPLGAPWIALLCLLVAAVALFWPEAAPLDGRVLKEAVVALAGAKDADALGARLRAVLGRVYRNAYVIAIESAEEGTQLRCLHDVLPPSQGAPLPARFAGGELAPVARLLEQGAPIHRHEAEMEGEKEDKADPRSLRRFWQTYALSALWPARADEGERLRGLIALGPPFGAGLARENLQAITRLFAAGLALFDEHERSAGQQRALKESVTQAHHSLSVALGDLEEARVKLLEAEKQAMVGRLAAGIVHEFNSPLGTLGSATDTITRALSRAKELIDTEVDKARTLRALGAQDSALEVIRQSHARLKDVVERVARFANLDSAEIKSIDLRTYVEDALALVQAQRGSSKISFSFTLPEQELAITCFPAKLSHALFNLLENAAAAIDGAGSVSVTVTRQAGSKALPAMAQIEVVDTGHGIAREKLPGLLDLAFTTRIGGRVGLRTGLPATRQAFVELGGDLVIESEPTKGTRAVATVPLGRKAPG